MEEAVLAALQGHIASVLDIEDTLGQIARLPFTARAVKKADGRIQAKRQEVERYRRYKMKLHEDYADGILSREDYIAFGKRYDTKISGAEEAMQALEAEIENLVSGNTGEQEWIGYFKEYRNTRELTRKLAVALIERIDVYEGKKIHILFRFQMEYDSARTLLGNTRQAAEGSGQDSPQSTGDFNKPACPAAMASQNPDLYQEDIAVLNGTALRKGVQ